MSQVQRGVTYAEIDGFRPLKLDLHVPKGRTDPPVAMWIHGGGFRSGDRDYLPWTYPPDAVWDELTAAGIACATVDYRLSAEAAWPAQRDDIAAVLAFLRANASRFGIDASRIGTWGESAGGHLALMAGMTDPEIRCVVAFYPVTDVVALGRDEADAVVAQLLGARPSTVPELARDASPIEHVSAGSPPCLFVHGDSDRVLPLAQSETMHDRLIEAGVESEVRVVPAADHCFDGYADVPQLIDDAVAFLVQHLTA